MSKVSIEFEIPEGYEFYRIGVPLKGEKYITLDSQIVSDEPCYKNCIIVTKRVKLSSLRDGQLFKFNKEEEACKKIVPHIIDGKLDGYLYSSIKSGATYLTTTNSFVIPINGDKDE